MRVVVLGASSNIGARVVRAIEADKSVDHVIVITRADPPVDTLGAEWRLVDPTEDDLEVHFKGVDAVVHLDWISQPARRVPFLGTGNVDGSARIFEATAKAGVGTLLYGSSVCVYSIAPRGDRVDESWPAHGIPSSAYSRQRAAVEQRLDEFEDEHPFVRVVRLRTAPVVDASVATSLQGQWLGRLFSALADPKFRWPLVPDIVGLAFQIVHPDDAAEAFRLALLGSVTDAYNIAAEPVIRMSEIADHFRIHRVPVPPAWAARAASLAWKAHAVPLEPGWTDLAISMPLVDTTRAQEILGWKPRVSSWSAVEEFREAMIKMREARHHLR